MEGEIDENVMLDCCVFKTSPTQNSYEALACSKGKSEKVGSGHLDQLALHLSKAKDCYSNPSHTSFSLKLVESQKGVSWFTKVTLAKFLNIVNALEELKVSIAIEAEMSQLEDTMKFHTSLYAKDQDPSGTGITDTNSLKEVGLNQQMKVETASSDATKKELLRALELRLMTLEEELFASFNRAAGATCSTQQISNLSEFAQQFEAIYLRNFFSKLSARIPKNIPTNSTLIQSNSLEDMRSNNESTACAVLQSASHTDPVNPVSNVISPAKIAQAERQSSSEGEESSDSSDEEQSQSERSRSLIRSATPRRSASPMRRIQIGRSGSRRSTSLTIKSLNHFPARERTTTSIRDADGSSSGDEKPEKKPENSVRRMSVQDAISLFESKQKDQNSDIQKRKALEVSAPTTKSVLRRWSSGSHINASESFAEDTREETISTEEKVEPLKTDESTQVPPNTEESHHVTVSSKVESAEPVILKVEEVEEVDDWGWQKEAELNLMMKMMDSKNPRKHQGTNGGSVKQQDVPSEQKGGFYSQEKQGQKLPVKNGGKRAVKEEQFKVMKESLEQSKTRISSRTTTAIRKQDSPKHSQIPRRNSSPPVLPKKEVSKPTVVTRKASPKASPIPKTSAMPSPKASTNTTTNRQKPVSAPSPTKPNPRTEKPGQPIKGKKGGSPDVKVSLKDQEEKKQRPESKSSKSVKTKSSAATRDNPSVVSAKPSSYNKVTKKSSAVPLESKSLLKKGTGISPRVAPVVTKAKVSQPNNSPKSSGNLIQAEVTPKVEEVDLVQLTNEDANLEVPLDHDVSSKGTVEGRDELDNELKNAVELPVPEIQAEEDVSISSAAWVEVAHKEGSASCDNALPELMTAVLSSPRVHLSLSQMMQEDNDPEMIEWGNAENPPSLIYQKDAPKGLKRLLKFARKSKGEANITGGASPSVFSEGEDDSEESKVATKRNSDVLLRKASQQTKGYKPSKSIFTASLDGGSFSKMSMDYQGMHDILPAQSSTGNATGLDRLREGQNPASSTSTKATTRSFFSLSTFRSNKSSETKLR